MNKTALIIIGIIILAIIGWYAWSMGDTEPVETPEMTEEMTEEMEEEETSEVIVNLAEQNDSGEYGTATLTEMDGMVQVVLSLIGAPQDVTQPAHIHVNSCAEIGGVAYPLEFPVNGTSETMLEVSMEDLRSAMPLSINVHKSVEEASVYVACGDLIL